MNIRHTKPGHTYGVCDYPLKRYDTWAPRYATIFPVKALALEGTYNKAAARTDYWSKSNGTAKGLKVEILQTLWSDGEIVKVRLPGMADRVQVKEGNIVVISGRAIQWDLDGYMKQAEHRSTQRREEAEREQEERQRLESIKGRLRVLGLGEWAEVDAPIGEWYPPEVYGEDQWEEFLTVLENARKEKTV